MFCNIEQGCVCICACNVKGRDRGACISVHAGDVGFYSELSCSIG